MWNRIFGLTVLFCVLLTGTSFADNYTLFGPKQYLRTTAKPNVYVDTFPAQKGEALLVIRNGAEDGNDRVTSAHIYINGQEIFGPSDFKKKKYLLEASITTTGKDTIKAVLASTPGNYLNIEIIQDLRPVEVSLSTAPQSVTAGKSAVLSWTSTDADYSVSITPGIGAVDAAGSFAVSPVETTTYTITAVGLGSTATANATVTYINTAPVADAQSVTLDEDASVSTTLSGSDIDNNPLTYQILTTPAHGILSGTTPNLTYAPDANYNGQDSFSFKVNDGQLDSASASVSIDIKPVNDVPVANSQSVSLDEDVSVAITLSGFDIDSDPLNYQILTAPGHGILSGTAPNLTYTPNADYNGPDTISFKVNDGQVDSAPASVAINVDPVNDVPVADPQSVALDEDSSVSITLSGSDIDNDPLTYQLSSGPVHGILSGTAPVFTYTPDADYHGPDSLAFTVNDGQVDSVPATVTITVELVNDTPVASAGPDQTSFRGETVTLDGSGSHDIDGDSLLYQWSFSYRPAGSSAVLSDPGTASPYFVPDIAGDYLLQLIVNDATVASPANIVVITANPVLVTVPNVEGMWQVEAEAAIVNAGLSLGTITNAHNDTVLTDNVISQNPVKGTVVEENTSVELVISLGPEIVAPQVDMWATPEIIQAGETSTLFWSAINAQSVFIDNGIGVVPAEGSVTLSTAHTTTYTISVAGALGAGSAQATIYVAGNPQLQPEGSFGAQYNDLIPPDATIQSYDPNRFSLITGLVGDLSDAPVSGVSITIKDHLEYGTVYTDDEGGFSIPVEGGGRMILSYYKEGMISSQRQVYVPRNEIAIAETVQMVAPDQKATEITFDGSPTVTTHQGTEVWDERGSHSTTMVFQGDNRAYAVDEQGNVIHELSTINIRATEFITPESLPAVIPAGSANGSANGYTVELAVDGVERVRFDKPVTIWIDNFLGIDVWEIVSVGYYDRDQGVWMPSDNGMVVRLLDTDGDGIVDALDADNDVLPDDLNDNGSFADEVIGLDDPIRYAPDSTFWRVSTTHFTPFFMSIKGCLESSLTLQDQVVVAGQDENVLAKMSITVGPSYEIQAGGMVTLTAQSVTLLPGFNAQEGSTVNIDTINWIDLSLPPIGKTDSFTVDQGKDVSGNVLLNDKDFDCDSFTARLVSDVSHGNLNLNPDGTFTYTHVGDETPSDQFTYKAVVMGLDESKEVVAYITINLTNNAPVAHDDLLTIDMNTSKTLNVLGNDIDNDYGDVLTITSVSTTTNGVVQLNNGNSITYTPENGFVGQVTFSYTIKDLIGVTSTATVTINVVDNPPCSASNFNTPPIAEDDSFSVLEGEAVTADVLINDRDLECDPLTAELVSNVSHGTLVPNTDGSFTYTHDGSETTHDSFTYQAKDAELSNIVTVSITVKPVNDVPVANDDKYSVYSYTATMLDVLANDFDADPGDTLTISSVTLSPNFRGEVVNNGDSLTYYTPAVDFVGMETFTYTVQGGNGEPATVTVYLGDVPPEAIAQAVVTDEFKPIQIVLTGEDFDNDQLTFELTSYPERGAISGTPPVITYSPQGVPSGQVSFTFTVNDSHYTSPPATVSITVNEVEMVWVTSYQYDDLGRITGKTVTISPVNN